MAWQRIVVGGLMVNACNRRKFIARTVAAGLGFNVLDAPLGLRPVAAAEAAVTPDLVRFGDDIEPPGAAD